MNHLSELLERLELAEIAYRIADGSLDSSPLEVIVCREELKQCRFKFDKACREYVLANVFVQEIEEEIEA